MSDRNARGSPDIRVLKYSAPVLLSTLAIIQIFLGLNFGLTPWKGGGFGMFSTVDGASARDVRVYLETANGEIPTRVPRWLENRRAYTRSFPTDSRVRGIAEELAAAAWVYERDADSSNPRDTGLLDQAESTPIRDRSTSESPYPRVKSFKRGKKLDEKFEVVDVTAVRVEVWRYRFAFETNRARVEPMKKVTVQVYER